MALIKCPECSNEVSDKASSCPKCGLPLHGAAPHVPADLDLLIRQTLSREGKIAAIELYRDYNPSAGVVEAAQYVGRLTPAFSPSMATKPPERWSPILTFGGLFIAGCVVFVIWATLPNQTSSTNDSPPAESPAVHAEPAAQAPSNAPLSSISWSEIDAIYNLKSKNTDLQKDAAWERYKGKRVKWTGTVSSVSESLGTLSLQVKMNPDTFSSDLLIRLNGSEKSRALNFKIGDPVSFTGILHRWGSLLPITLRDGEIVSY